MGPPSPRDFFVRTAFFVDGAFFLRRHYRLEGPQAPWKVAKALHEMCRGHLRERRRAGNAPIQRAELYRIFYYDCLPLDKKAHNPITGKAIDFGKTRAATWRLAFLDELKKLRKVAVRFGHLKDKPGHWNLRPEIVKELLAGRLKIENLTERDVKYEVRQKGVDMRLGLDIASIAYKKQADQIILVAGDSDFVPAAKLARREGLDVILDPMWSHIPDDLHEHIDGLRTVLPRPGTRPQVTPVATAVSQPPS